MRLANARIITIKFPPTGQDIDIRFEHDWLNDLYKYEPVKFQNLLTAVEVLKNPTRIYVGLKRILSNNGLCFVGKPKKWYIREDKLVDFPKDKLVYTVFLNDRYSVFELRATEVDFFDPESPIDWAERFGGEIWKKDF